MRRLAVSVLIGGLFIALLVVALPAWADEPTADVWWNGSFIANDPNVEYQLISDHLVHVVWHAPAGNFVSTDNGLGIHADQSGDVDEIEIWMWGVLPFGAWYSSPCPNPGAAFTGAIHYNVDSPTVNIAVSATDGWWDGDTRVVSRTFDVSERTDDLSSWWSGMRSCPSTSAPATDYDFYVQIHQVNDYDVYEDEPDTWGELAWLYYPYTQADYWSTYQSYTETTWYGDTYTNTNVFRLRPGAPVYPIAKLGIEDVGVNTFGYYIDARINAWPDVPSTTVRYEGLQTVNVSAGQEVGPNCELGTVNYNSALNQYHLLLYTEFDGTPINPVPYMNRWPDGTLCFTGIDDTPGPGAGEVDSRILAVCQACQPPSSWTNFGRWIVWLECMIRNLFTCWLVEWINAIISQQILALEWGMSAIEAVRLQLNSIIGVQIMTFDRLVALGPWAAEPLAGGLDWLGDLASLLTAWVGGVLDYTGARADALAARLDNLGYIIMSYGGGGVTYIYNEAGTNYWDVVVAVMGLLGKVVDLLISLIDGAFELINGLLGLIVDMARLLLLIVTALMSGILDSQPGGDMAAMSTGLSTVDCTATGVWSSSGPSAGKAVCYFLAGLQLLDDVIVRTPLAYLPGIVIGILAIVVVLWVLGQFRELIPS